MSASGSWPGAPTARRWHTKQGATEWGVLSTFPEFSGLLLGAGQPIMAPVIRDKSVKQFGVLNIVLGMLCGGINTTGLVALIYLVDKGVMVMQTLGWIILIGVVLLNATAIASGISLLLYRKWGRVLALIYAGGTIVFILGSIALNISNAAASEDPAAARRGGKQTGRVCFQLIYPIILLVYMNKQNVRRSLS